MKKHWFFALALIVVLAVSVNAWAAAGSCEQTPLTYSGSNRFTVTFVCTGDSGNGSIPTAEGVVATGTMTRLIKGGYFLYSVKAFPTSGGTAPDAADVTVKSANSRDLLGGKGVNLIHATAEQSTAPYNAFSTLYEFPSIVDTLTMGVANQATASANFTIVLDFER